MGCGMFNLKFSSKSPISFADLGETSSPGIVKGSP